MLLPELGAVRVAGLGWAAEREESLPMLGELPRDGAVGAEEDDLDGAVAGVL